MEEPSNPRPRVDAPPAAAVAVSVAVSLPLWRAALPGNTYILQPTLLPLHGTLASVAYAAALAGIGLALALLVMPCTRRLAAGGGALLAPLGLLVLAALLFVFQF